MSVWKKNIIKVITITLWCAIGIGSVALLIAAMRKKNQELCKGYQIRISGAEHEEFIPMGIGTEEIEAMLFGKSIIINRPIASIDLRKMEEKLEGNVWVRDAQLFFDNKDRLQVLVKEKKPVARVFTTGGNSFYIDSSGGRLPLSDKFCVHLPVFTNFPSEKIKLKTVDSSLLRQMAGISAFISQNDFWSAQVAQIDITSNRTFEMVPLL